MSKRMPFDGYKVVMVASGDSGLSFNIFLKSAGVKPYNEAPFIWVKNHTGYEKIRISENADCECKKWISDNYELLIKHWNCELSDRGILNMLKRI